MSDEMNDVSFPKIEHEILDRWETLQIFKKSLDSNKKAYSFYDGPPFATGLPHYGHLLASTLKDVIPRYWTMRGFHVERRWGWDCHGLPIEQEIDKKFGFKNTGEIENFGIAKYNQECREIVLRFTEEWKKTIRRLGRWVDFDNSYKTMDRDFMESVWWVIRRLWDEKLIYRGHTVMPFSTPLGTPLSNSEAGSNYMTVQDPAITISFPLKSKPEVSFLAWTTTPWTLPSNLALAVGKDITYATVKTKDHKFYIVAKDLIPIIFKKQEAKILEEKSGQELVGLEYEPLFNYFSDKEKPHFTVLLSDHVTTDSGTGIVHMAPAFGEEDFRACRDAGLEPVCPVNAHGEFTDAVKDFKGQYVKDADKDIIKRLKDEHKLFDQATINHAYPYCPRTDTPLIQRLMSSWFVNVEKIREKMAKNNQEQTHWVPDHLRDNRFGNWLKGARDWNISRLRFWGNPLPIWESFEDPEEERDYLCFGSVKDLEETTGKKLEDIHREFLDPLIIEKQGKKYRRIPDVLDCWFESGSMPYAQAHYPFENKESFENSFPADFIAEGLDQTRGWFYTLTVLGTILFDKVPFKNVVVNGMILAADGKKMSKRLKNYPDPNEVIEKYGSDALRLYLINSPVIRGEELRLSEEGVKDVVRKVILKWWNAYTFFQSYAEIDRYEAQTWITPPPSQNILDQWIVSRLQSLLLRAEKEMEVYRLYRVIPEVLYFIEELTNTYIRLNRSRFWSEGFNADKKSAFDTLHYTLLTFSKVMAPFAPFLSEKLYLLLTDEKEKDSVHLEDYPRASEEAIQANLEQGVAALEEVILLGRQIREQHKVKVKVPLKEITIVHRKESVLKIMQPLESYLTSELNVRKISYQSNESDYVEVQCKANGATLGRRAGKMMKEASQKVANLSFEELEKLDQGESLPVLDGLEITSEDVKVFRNPVKGTPHPVASSIIITVALDISVDKDQELEGLAREVVNRIQTLRKNSKLNLDDRIHVQLKAEGELKEAVKSYQNYIQEQTLAQQLQLQETLNFKHQEAFEIDQLSLHIALEVGV